MPEDAPILVCLAEKEKNDFFPLQALGELQELSSQIRFVDALSLTKASWREELVRFRPEILVTCWKTPQLPEELAGSKDFSVKYLCHLAGSVRKVVSNPFIENGLIVTNWGSSISRVVAECGLFLIIACLRRSTRWALDMHCQGAWKNQTTVFHSLFGRSVGIHGFGLISQHLTRLLIPFEVPVTTYSPSVPDNLLAEYGVRRAYSLEELFSKNNVIVELAALTPKNFHIITENLLHMIPESGVFVNVGRGAVVDEAALLKIALEGKLQIGLDVFEKEPLHADSGFRGLTNVTLLPHLGGPTIDRRCDSGKLALKNLKRYLNKEPLEAVVSKEVYERAT